MKHFIGVSLVLSLVPAVHAMSIAEAKQLASLTPVSIDNVVIVSDVDLINSASVKNFQVRDLSPGLLPWLSGASATVFGANADMDALLAGASVGDVISFSGETTTFNGLFEIQGSALNPLVRTGLDDTNYSVGKVQVLPSMFQDAAPEGELFESNVVQLSGAQFDLTGTFSGGVNYGVSVNGVSITARVSRSDMDLVGTAIPTGRVNITGVMSQFDSTDPRDGGYQLLLRSVSDLEAEASPILHGRVQLEAGQRAELYGDTLQLEFLQDDGTPISGAIGNVKFTSASGVFAAALNPVAATPFRVRVKSNVWLSKVVPAFGDPAATNLEEILPMVSLISGDVDGDNEVGPNDFSILSGSFGLVDGDPGFNSNADLDGDSEVGPSDFSILASHFGESGE